MKDEEKIPYDTIERLISDLDKVSAKGLIDMYSNTDNRKLKDAIDREMKRRSK